MSSVLDSAFLSVCLSAKKTCGVCGRIWMDLRLFYLLFQADSISESESRLEIRTITCTYYSAMSDAIANFLHKKSFHIPFRCFTKLENADLS